MNPASKGWLKEYIAFRQVPHKALTGEGRKALHPDHSLYRMLQPSGLMYGQPMQLFDHPDAGQWSEKDLMKILLADSLISGSLLFHDKMVEDPAEMSALTSKTLENVANFYNHVFPELATSTKTLFGRKKTPEEQTEQILEKRIESISGFKDNFWTKFFHNSLLFLDVFIFGQWIHTNADKIVSDFFKYEREELRTSVVRIMAAAAHANHIVEFEERKLMEFFLQSAHLPPEKKKECQEIFEKGISIEEINLPTNNSWLLKKYFLEVAILTVWADRKVEETELAFIHRFATTLSFSAEELDNSMMAVEGFVLEHWEELNRLQDRKEFEQVSQLYINRMLKLTGRNKGRLLKEVKGREDLMELLRKAQVKELNDQEKSELRNALTETLKVIPSLSVMSLPRKFMTLPVLMQIFPKNFISECVSD